VCLIPDLSDRSAAATAAAVLAAKRPGDLAVVSLHWGSNWGYDVDPGQVRFAHRLIDAGVDLVHGHSSHHPRPIETYHGKLVLYGCGDAINDYEGIPGHAAYRAELRLLYFASLDPGAGLLRSLRMVPLTARRMRLHRARDTAWLRSRLHRISRRFGTRIDHDSDGALTLRVA
jgi:poly-gamma-glutamate capsule biosynthesis protein CapA/YwtB (metallophosphatase superfamily)